MDRLPLLKALADDSRYAIYAELGRSTGPRSTTELAERLDLHPNTVRLHLERLREVGLIEMSVAAHGSVGRPQHHWTVAARAPSLGLEPSGFRILAHLLAEAAGESGVAGDLLVDVGRRRAGERGGVAPGSAADGDEHDGAGSGRGAPDCVRVVIDELADLGFDPVVEPPAAPSGEPRTDGLVGVAFTRCPFRELAALYPDLVCALHRGLTEGIVASASLRTPGVGAHVAGFSTLVDADPCRATLAVGGPAAGE